MKFIYDSRKLIFFLFNKFKQSYANTDNVLFKIIIRQENI